MKSVLISVFVIFFLCLSVGNAIDIQIPKKGQLIESIPFGCKDLGGATLGRLYTYIFGHVRCKSKNIFLLVEVVNKERRIKDVLVLPNLSKGEQAFTPSECEHKTSNIRVSGIGKCIGKDIGGFTLTKLRYGWTFDLNSKQIKPIPVKNIKCFCEVHYGPEKG